MRYLSISLLLVFLVSPSIGLCQNELDSKNSIVDWNQTEQGASGSFKLVAQADGTFARIPFSNAPPDLSTELGRATAAAQARKKERELNKLAKLALTRLNTQKVGSLSNIELSSQQARELKSVFDSFRTVNRDDFDAVSESVRSVRDILLPEQLFSLADTQVGRSGIFQFIQTPKIASALELTSSQKEMLIQKCKEANLKLQKDIEELEKLARKRQQELRAILLKTLSDSQEVELSTLVDKKIDEMFTRSNFYDMQMYTRESESTQVDSDER